MSISWTRLPLFSPHKKHIKSIQMESRKQRRKLEAHCEFGEFKWNPRDWRAKQVNSEWDQMAQKLLLATVAATTKAVQHSR